MANHKSAAKRARQSVLRNERNRVRKSQMLKSTKAVVTAITAGNAEEATAKLRRAESTIARTASKGVIHPRTAARKVSRLAKAVKTMALSGK